MITFFVVIIAAQVFGFVINYFAQHAWCSKCHCFSKIITNSFSKPDSDEMHEYCICKKCGKVLVNRTFTSFDDE